MYVLHTASTVNTIQLLAYMACACSRVAFGVIRSCLLRVSTLPVECSGDVHFGVYPTYPNRTCVTSDGNSIGRITNVQKPRIFRLDGTVRPRLTARIRFPLKISV